MLVIFIIRATGREPRSLYHLCADQCVVPSCQLSCGSGCGRRKTSRKIFGTENRIIWDRELIDRGSRLKNFGNSLMLKESSNHANNLRGWFSSAPPP